MISLLLQLITIIPGLGALQPVPAADAVQRLAGPPARRRSTTPRSSARSWVCALYAMPCLVVAFLVFLRRDVAGG